MGRLALRKNPLFDRGAFRASKPQRCILFRPYYKGWITKPAQTNTGNEMK